MTEVNTDVWDSVFQALSVVQFDVIKNDLGFSAKVSNQLRNLSREFSATYLSVFCGIETPIVFDNKYWHLSNADLQAPSLLEQFIAETLDLLRTMNSYESVHAWRETVYNNPKYYEDRSITSTYGEEWYKFLLDWVTEPGRRDFEPIKLSYNRRKRLENIVTSRYCKASVRKWQINGFYHRVPEGSWERFLFAKQSLSAWFVNQVDFQLNLKMWSKIFALLTSSEVEMFVTAGQNYFGKYWVEQPPFMKPDTK